MTRLAWWEVLALLIGWLLGQQLAWGQEGLATYYTTASCQREGTSGVRTANGEAYDELDSTVALPHRDFGGQYRVCAIGTGGRCVLVVHNDYGPGRAARRRGVIIDLTPAAYDAIGGKRGVTRRGVAWGEVAVTVERVR